MPFLVHQINNLNINMIFIYFFIGNIDFWNRIARRQSGGSGSTYVEGWSLAFIGFKENGRYFLNSLDDIQKSNNYGYLVTLNR